jgi:hypothetical protein
MAASSILNPNNPDFERFLYASVGEDRAGSTVSVLSALARQNLDPWVEAAELAALGRSGAGARLSLLLSRSREVPRLGQDHQAVAHDLARLLPEHKGRMTSSGDPTPKRVAVSWHTLLAIMAIIYMLIQTIFSGATGPGD